MERAPGDDAPSRAETSADATALRVSHASDGGRSDEWQQDAGSFRMRHFCEALVSATCHDGWGKHPSQSRACVRAVRELRQTDRVCAYRQALRLLRKLLFSKFTCLSARSFTSRLLLCSILTRLSLIYLSRLFVSISYPRKSCCMLTEVFR